MNQCNNGWIEETIESNRTLPAVFDYDPKADPVKAIIATLKTLSLVKEERGQNTRIIMSAIAKLGLEKFRYSCYTNRIGKCKFNIVEPPHHYFTTREWLYDLIWFEDDEKSGEEYSIKSFPLALESEWDFSRNKAKIKGVSYAAVKYDLQKLVICNASLKVMIFREYAENGVEKLKKMSEYIVTLLAEYKPKVNGQFLCIACSPNMKSFKYKLFCPQEEK